MHGTSMTIVCDLRAAGLRSMPELDRAPERPFSGLMDPEKARAQRHSIRLRRANRRLCCCSLHCCTSPGSARRWFEVADRWSDRARRALSYHPSRGKAVDGLPRRRPRPRAWEKATLFPDFTPPCTREGWTATCSSDAHFRLSVCGTHYFTHYTSRITGRTHQSSTQAAHQPPTSHHLHHEGGYHGRPDVAS